MCTIRIIQVDHKINTRLNGFSGSRHTKKVILTYNRHTKSTVEVIDTNMRTLLLEQGVGKTFGFQITLNLKSRLSATNKSRKNIFTFNSTNISTLNHYCMAFPNKPINRCIV